MSAYRPDLTAAQIARIASLKGRQTAEAVAGAYGIKTNSVLNIWRGRTTGKKRRVEEHHREAIIRCYAAGGSMLDMINAAGFSEPTVRLVLAEARAEGDMRASRDPAERQRAATPVAHNREGGSPGNQAAALPPNRVELSLIARGMRPEVARLTAKAWADRHGRIMRERPR